MNDSHNIRIYLVDDEDLVRESLGAMLKLEQGIEVVGEAARADVAVEQLEVLDADVVLMDIRVPGISGIDATRILAQTAPNVKVIILTALDDTHVEDAIDAGASGYILKTCTRQQLVAAIHAALQGYLPIGPSLTRRIVRELSQLRKALHEDPFTAREIKILQMISKGVRHKVIADELFISESTVQRDTRAIYDQLGVNDAVHAVSKAYKLGLL